jgi:hypothetical protein
MSTYEKQLKWKKAVLSLSKVLKLAALAMNLTHYSPEFS